MKEISFGKSAARSPVAVVRWRACPATVINISPALIDFLPLSD